MIFPVKGNGTVVWTAIGNISNPTMRTGLHFKSAQFDQARGKAEDWIKMRELEI
jgi:hypothetical protein